MQKVSQCCCSKTKESVERERCVNDTSDNKEHYVQQWDVNIMMQVHEHFDMFGCHRFITFVTMCPFSLETEWLPSMTQEDFSLIAAKKKTTHIVLHASCFSILCSSSLVIERRSRSVLSTTRMTIWEKNKNRPQCQNSYLIARELLICSQTTDKKNYVMAVKGLCNCDVISPRQPGKNG